MKILHISDTHGYFTKFHCKPDLIIHSGDLLPNNIQRLDDPKWFTHRDEPTFQTNYILNNASFYQEWLGDIPFLLCNGNHDFINAVPVLKSIGINAYNITEEMITFQQLNIYGFPYVPAYHGMYNYELLGRDMSDKVDHLGDVVEANYVDILVCHCPPYGVLDFTDERHGLRHIGNEQLINAFNYKWKHLPDWLLVGHVHENIGIAKYKNMTIINSATTSHIIEI